MSETTKIFGDGRVWRKGSRSSDQGGACVFVALTGDHVGLRDSKEGDHGPQLWIDSGELAGLKAALTQ